MERFKLKLTAIDSKEHAESFEISNTFLNENLEFKIIRSSLTLDVSIKKEGSSSYNLNCKIVGEINGIPCDLCAENLNIPIKIESSIIIKESKELLESTDEIFYIRPKQQRIDITHLIFEMITLAIPVKRTHKLDEHGDNTCNKEMLNLIKKYFTKKPVLNDSRWDPLKEITY